MPATKNAIMAGILAAKPTLLEPMLSIEAKTTQENIGSVIGVLNRHRGKVLDMIQSEYMVTIKGEIPVIESFTLSDELRSATAGRVFWSLQFSRWSPVPENMLMDMIMKIRERKGLPKEIPKIEDFVSQY